MQQEFNDTETIYPIPEQLNLFTATQQGNFEFIKQHLNDPNIRDSESTTLLHWSAINNHDAISHYLLCKGANANALGGALLATPLHWACRSGHSSTCALLLENNANPHLKDGQGYNCLHLAAHAGMDIDCRDDGGRTALHWTAYNGTSIDSVNVLISCGAGLDLVDNGGFTPLHWAIVSSHYEIVYTLIDAGCDLGIKDLEGKTARDWALERKTGDQFDQVLLKIKKKPLSLPEKYCLLITALIPFLWMITSLGIVYVFIWYYAVPLVVILAYTSVKAVTNLFNIHLVRTPIMCAIPVSTIAIVFFHWLYIVRAVVSDPGYCKQSRKNVIEELAKKGELDARHYCYTCKIQKPLRSKHCKICEKCVGKMGLKFITPDHHCPWTFNCIGYANHRSFISFLFLISLDGIIYVTMAFPSIYSSPTSIALFVWVLFNTCWILFLLAAQIYQISIGKTTNEASVGHRYEYFVHPLDRHLPMWKRRQVNPFDDGVVGNWVGFWNGGVDWRLVYAVDRELEMKVIKGNV